LIREQGGRYLKLLLGYIQSSETVFLLLFSNMIGVGAGFGAILFRWLIGFFQNLFFDKGQHVLSFMGSYYVIIIPAIGGIFVGLLIYFFSSESKGHGVPEVMLAVATAGSKIRPRVAAMKALISSICIGSGGSVGREGPIIQISSALGSAMGQLFRFTEDKKRILIACGAAGGIAATFNAPLAGIFFALEVILREYGTRYFSSVVLSAVTATIISRTFLGSNPAFMVPPYALVSSWEILFYFILGFLAAFIGWVFIKVLYKSEDIFDSIKIPSYVKPAIGGLILGVIGFYFPQIFGVGYPSIELTMNGNLAPFLILGLIGLKILATSLTLGSGGSGGVFAPSLFIGVMLGSSFGSLIHILFPAMEISPGAYALVGMGAVFAGAAQAPISAIMILFEMTGDYKIILPLMITCVISTLVIKKISKDSIYTLKLRRRGIDIINIKNQDLMDMILVSEAMFRHVDTVIETIPVRDAGLMIKRTTHRGFPVLDSDGRLTGMVTQQDINKALNSGRSDIPVAEIMTRDLVVCYPEESLKTALEKLGERNIGRIPVVKPNDPTHLVGLITRKGIITAYNLELQKRDDEPQE
ncbi:MAG TPA: chloride channel protein, partial [Desulfatiglandales bacterium]|nr:chloride channel protein [Desulfatiglandales bacterium]